MRYMVGIDGGGTKTEAVAYRLDGEKLSIGRSGYGNPLIDEAQATAHIIEAIQQCTRSLEGAECVYVYIGLAGYEGLASTAKLEKAVASIVSAPFIITNDANIAHAAQLQGKDGVLTIAGTGSISLAVLGDVTEVAGGWGHLLGDEGSGYWIAMQALVQLTREADQGRTLSPLSQQLLSHLKYEKADEIKKFVYNSTKDTIASIVPVVVTLAETDQGARQLLAKAGEQLAKTAISASRKCSFGAHVTFAVKGSILTAIPIVQHAFIDAILEEVPQASFILEEVSATIGCYYLALDLIGKKDREDKERYRH